MVRRRHGSEPDRTCAELEKLIQEQTVLKVNYKGSVSYRNAAKVQRRSRKKDDGTLATVARRSTVEEASHSDLSNGDSAFGPVDQDEEDLEVCCGLMRGVGMLNEPHVSLSYHISSIIMCGVRRRAGKEWFCSENRVFLSVCGEWFGGVICKCTQNCRRRGASVGPRTSAAEVEKGGKKKQKVRVQPERGIFHAGAPVDKHFKPAIQSHEYRTGKVVPSCPFATTRATIISGRKRFFEPQTQRCAKGSGGLQ